MNTEKGENKIIKLLKNWQVVATILLGIVVTAISIRTAFWEYDDKSREREERLRKINREQDNKDQVALLRVVLKEELDSMMSDFNEKTSAILEQSIKKDSLLLLIVPKIGQEVTQANENIDKLNHKFSIVLEEQEPSSSVDFVKLLNERDSLANIRFLADSMNFRIYREIRELNLKLLGDEKGKPKYGDRIK